LRQIGSIRRALVLQQPGDEELAVEIVGIACIAAIQELHQIVQDKDCEISELKSQNAEFSKKNSELEARLARIERLVGEGLSRPNGGER